MKCFQSGGLLRLLHLCSLMNLYLERSCLVRFSTPPSPFLIIPPSVPPFTPLSQPSPLLLKSHLYLLSFHSSSAPHSLLFLLLTLSNSCILFLSCRPLVPFFFSSTSSSSPFAFSHSRPTPASFPLLSGPCLSFCPSSSVCLRPSICLPFILILPLIAFPCICIFSSSWLSCCEQLLLGGWISAPSHLLFFPFSVICFFTQLSLFGPVLSNFLCQLKWNRLDHWIYSCQSKSK